MAKTRRLLALIVLLGLALGAMPMSAATGPAVAVLPFDDGSIQNRWWWHDWDVGKGVSDMIVTELLAQKNFRLIEREMIEKIIQEQNFGASGRVDTRSAAQIGKIAGVKYIIMGRVTEFTVDTKGGTIAGISIKSTTARVALDGKIVDTTTAEIIAAVAGKGEKSQGGFSLSVSNFPHVAFGAKDFEETILGQATRQAIAGFCTKLTTEMTGTEGAAVSRAITGKVAAFVSNKIYLNIGAAAGVKSGMVFVIGRVVQEIKDPDTGKVLDVVTEPICEITINDVKESSCSGPITSALGGGQPKPGDTATLKT